MFWAIVPILVGFFYLASIVLRWVHRRALAVPAANAGTDWSLDNKFIEEYRGLSKHADIAPTAMAQALMRRAMKDIEQAIDMQEHRSTLESLMKAGSISDVTWTRFVAAEEAMSKELSEVAGEAERLKPGWGEGIFQQAQQFLALESRRRMEQEAKEQEEREKARAEVDKKAELDQLKTREQEAQRIAQELIEQEEREKQQPKQRKSSGSSGSGQKKK